MDQRHQDYIDYYRARVKKYENNPLYPHSYQSELALLKAITSIQNLDEFKAKLDQDNLTTKNAVALVKDQETARLALWEELQESIRAQECREILAFVDNAKTVMELVTTISEIRQKHSLAQAVDGFVDNFYGDFLALENLAVDQLAEVPSRWRNEIKERTAETLRSGRELFQEVTLPRAREWDPQWQMNYQLVWEDRHRRTIPVPDQVISRRIEDHKTYWGIA